MMGRIAIGSRAWRGTTSLRAAPHAIERDDLAIDTRRGRLETGEQDGDQDQTAGGDTALDIAFAVFGWCTWDVHVPETRHGPYQSVVSANSRPWKSLRLETARQAFGYGILASHNRT